jgi:hypothetical protein
VPAAINFSDLMSLILVTDAFADERRGDHDLGAGDATLAAGPRDEALRDDGLQDAGELQPDLTLLVGRKDHDDAVDRFGGIERVDRGEHEVTGFCRHQGLLVK